MGNVRANKTRPATCACGARFQAVYMIDCPACLTRLCRAFWKTMGSTYTDEAGKVRGLIPGEQISR